MTIYPTDRITVHFYGIKGTDEVVHVSADSTRNRSSFLIFVGRPGEMKQYPHRSVEEYANGGWYIRVEDPHTEQDGDNQVDLTCLLFCPGPQSTAEPTWDDRPLDALKPDDYNIDIVARFNNITRRTHGSMAITPKNSAQPMGVPVAAAS